MAARLISIREHIAFGQVRPSAAADAAAIESLWRSAAFDFLDACFEGAPSEVIRERAAIFNEVNILHRRAKSAPTQ